MKKTRIAARGLVERNGKFLLLKSLTEDTFITPGGGVEGDETLVDALTRELVEEAGLIAKPIQEYSVIENVVEHPIYNIIIHHYFHCEYIDEGFETNFTEQEAQDNLVNEWLDFDQLHLAFKECHHSEYRWQRWYEQEKKAMEAFLDYFGKR
jgi:ADP-ribose pyrophosphatase YjhB (NUDIX family)